MKLFAVLSHSFSSYFALRGPDIFLILSLCSSLSVTDQVPHPHKFCVFTDVEIEVVIFFVTTP